MRFKAKFKLPRFNLGTYKAAVAESMARIIGEAAREWLGAVAPAIPVWSGASAATLVPLASQVDFALSISPVVSSRFSLGLENAQGEIESDSAEGLFTFTYSTTLPHLIWNEFHNANIDPDPTKFRPPAELHNPGPYDFQTKGENAFRQYAQGVLLPSPLPSLTTTIITV